MLETSEIAKRNLLTSVRSKLAISECAQEHAPGFSPAVLDTFRVVGTSHISKDSLRAVESVIVDFKPDIVAVELDRNRLMALMQKGRRKGPGFRDIRRLGFKGWIFGAFGAWIEKTLGKRVGVSPGDEMLVAVRLAAKTGARVALIDRDIAVTLRRFGKALSWREKWNFLVDVVKGLFGFSSFKFDISKVPSKDLLVKILDEVKRRYPNVYRVLISERNVFMAKALAVLVSANPDSRIVAVVGAGHEDDIVGLLQKYLKK